MAMEIHALQPKITDASTALGSLTRQMTELTTTLGTRTDVPADVKTSFEGLNKELTALAPKLAAPQGGRGGGGGGRGGPTESLTVKIGQAKNGLMGGMTAGESTTRAYTEVRLQTPKAIADLNAVIAKAATLSTSLAKYNITLTVPQPVQIPAAPAPAKRAQK